MSALTDSIDVKIEQYWPLIKAKQAQFHDEHGRYWQGPATHSEVPADGEEVPADNLDQVQDTLSWRDWNILPATMTSCLRFDVSYHPSTGHSYGAVFSVVDNGVLKQRSLGQNDLGGEVIGEWIELGDE